MLQHYSHILPLEHLNQHLAKEYKRVKSDPNFHAVRQALDSLHAPDPNNVILNVSDIIEIDTKCDVEEDHNFSKSLERIIQALIPWRVGPYSLFGHDIESEWDSAQKWHRIQSAIASVRSKRVADVGGNNGYFLYQMLKQEPELLMCIDPVPRCYYQFQLLQLLKPVSQMFFAPLSIDALGSFPKFFDTILCMGVLYHRRDPSTSLHQLFSSLKSGGQCILETLYCQGEEHFCLCPINTYAKMPNVWFIPTLSVLKYWLERVGFKEIKIISCSTTDQTEQRSTVHAPGESLIDFIDPSNSQLTVEGYPLPRRVVFSAWKP